MSIFIICGFHLTVQAETRDWIFDSASDYTVSDPAAIEVNGGVAQTISGFDGFGWNYREALTINNPNSELEEYQIEVKLDSSHSGFWAHIADDGSDIRFTDSDGMTFIDFYIYHFDYTLKEAGIWIKVPLISTPAHAIYLYYGNESATDASDMVETFSYSEPRTVGYVISNRIATAGNLKIVSLADGNAVEGTSYNLDEQEKTQVSNPDLSQGTPISATKLFHADGSSDGTDMISPVSWAATEFTYYSMRNTNTFHLLSPWGEADVEIYDGGSQVWSGTVDGSGTVTSVTATTIAATVPKGMTPGFHGVSVKNPDGKIATLTDAFLVIDSSNPPDPDLPPFVEGLYPSTITNGEDTPIVILGENFIEIPEVVVGERVLSEVDYISPYTLRVTIPGDMPGGSYDVTVINPNGLSHLLEEGLVVVEPSPPVVLYLLPDSTEDDVAIDVGIIGFNFEVDSKVTLGETELTDVIHLSSTTLMVTVPAGTPAGVYDIVVANSDGRSGRLKNGFTVISTQPTPPENVDLTVFPDVLLGSRWLSLFNLVLIECEDELTFTPSSLASFDSGDIRIWAQGVWGDHTLAVFLSLDANPQEGVVNITVSDVDLGGEMVIVVDPDALTISLLPLILEER